MSKVNRYFDKVFVINLYDNHERWAGMQKQLKRRKIKAERFVAVDGRCKHGEQACREKLATFEHAYGIKIKVPKGSPASKFLPAASLSIGTILLLRAMVRNGWKRMLIFEDDVHFVRGFEAKFAALIKDVGDRPWDQLYLGCGGECGVRGVSTKRDRKHPHASPWENDDPKGEASYFTSHVDDLRYADCDPKVACKPLTSRLTRINGNAGTWAYAYSLRGAKRVLRALGDTVDDHIDQALMRLQDTTLVSLAADPPIVMHENLRKGRKTDIPWE